MDATTNKQGTTLKTAVESFILARRADGLRPGSLKFYEEKIGIFTRWCDGQGVTTLEAVTPDLLRAFMLELENGHNPGGRHAVYRSVRALFRWWWDEYEPDGRNPISRVKAPKVPEEPLDPVQPATVDALLETCSAGTFADLRDKAAFLFLLDTGLRAGELLALNLDHIAPDGVVTVERGKGGKPRSGYIGKKTRRALRAYLKARTDAAPALWVTTTGDRLTYDGLRSAVVRRAALIGVEPPPLHSFRRWFAITMLRAGVDVFALRDLMGHSDIGVLRRYVKQTQNDTRAAHQRGAPVDNR